MIVLASQFREIFFHLFQHYYIMLFCFILYLLSMLFVKNSPKSLTLRGGILHSQRISSLSGYGELLLQALFRAYNNRNSLSKHLIVLSLTLLLSLKLLVDLTTAINIIISLHNLKLKDFLRV